MKFMVQGFCRNLLQCRVSFLSLLVVSLLATTLLNERFWGCLGMSYLAMCFGEAELAKTWFYAFIQNDKHICRTMGR